MSVKPTLVVQCQNTPLTPQQAEWARNERIRIARLEQFGSPLPMLFPPDAYAIMFGMRADAAIQKSIQRLVQPNRQPVQRKTNKRFADGPGIIYMFWLSGHARDFIKIGRSTQTAEERLAEWNRSLTREIGGRVVNQLFLFSTRYNILAESLIKTTLSCERLPNLRHERTGEALTEFFQIDNIMLARLFILLCVQYADAIGGQRTIRQ